MISSPVWHFHLKVLEQQKLGNVYKKKKKKKKKLIFAERKYKY